MQHVACCPPAQIVAGESQSMVSIPSSTSLRDEEAQHLEEGMRSRTVSQPEPVSKAHKSVGHVAAHPTSLSVQTTLAGNKLTETENSTANAINTGMLPSKHPLASAANPASQHTHPGTPSNTVSW